MPMPCIRLTDKLNRLCSLTKNSSQRVQDESIEDTLKDLATYSVMTLIELRREKGIGHAD
nr:MAG TPA: Nucleotide modification associated domain 1 [Caudoviricetes sp.]